MKIRKGWAIKALGFAVAWVVQLVPAGQSRVVGLKVLPQTPGLVVTQTVAYSDQGHDTAEAGAGAGLYNIGEGKQGLTIAGARFTGGTWFARRLDLVVVSALIWAAISRSWQSIVSLFVLLPYLIYLLFLSGARGAIAGGAVAVVAVLKMLSLVAHSGRDGARLCAGAAGQRLVWWC